MRHLLAVTLLVVLSACNGGGDVLPDWLGTKEEKAKLEGKRISILTHRTNLKARPAADRAVIPTDEVVNKAWRLQADRPAENLALGKAISKSATISLGAGAGERLRLTSAPVVANSTVYALDGKGVVTARALAQPKKALWKYTVDSGKTESTIWDFDSGKKPFIGGNIALANGQVFVSTASGQVVVLTANNGELVWQRNLQVPLRSAPTVTDNSVYVTSSNSRLYSLSVADGSTRWTYDGIAERTSIFGAPRAVVYDDIVVVAFASGELTVLDQKTGRVRWKDILLNSQASFASLVAINDIDATPLVHQGSVYAISHDGVLTAYSLDTGRKRWTQNVSSVQTPWIAGDFLFVVTTHDELAAISTLDGRIQWVRALPSYADARFSWAGSNRGSAIDWVGPVLAGNALWLIGSDGRLLSADVFSGKITSQIKIRDDVYLAPVVVDKTMLILGNDAKMTIFK